MGIVMSSGNSTRLIGEKFDVEAAINDIVQEISQLQNLSTILADGKVTPEEFDGVNYYNLPHIAKFLSDNNPMAVDRQIMPAFALQRRHYSPKDQQYLKECMRRSFLEAKGKETERKLHYREQQLTQKKDRLEKRLKLIDAEIQANEQLFSGSVKMFAPKFGGGQQ